jgi:repressor LexA
MTRRQQEVLEAIADLTALRGYPPSLREIGAHVGANPSTTKGIVDRLVRDGHAAQEPHTPRSLRVVG